MDDRITIFKNQFNTALIADAAYRSQVAVGVAPSAIRPLSPAWKMAGPVRTVRVNNDLVSVLGAMHHSAPGEILVMTNPTAEVGLLGDLIATEAKRRGLGGFVVDGLVRDTQVLVDLGVPVFSRGQIPIGPLKVAAELKGIGETDCEVTVGEVKVVPGMWAVGDADGVIFLPPDRIDDVWAQARESAAREERLFDAMRNGEALGVLLEIDRFLEERGRDPRASFNEHLNRIGRAI